jgi:hypothetical protein
MWLRPSVLALFLFVLGLPHHSLAQEGQPAREAKVKVAFIYNFAKFANWPDRAFETLPHNSFSICLVGKEPLGNLLDQLAGSKTIKGRTILFRKNPPQHDLRNCRILYISSSESLRLDRLLKAVAGHPVLTIGSAEGYAKRGAGINLFEKNGKLSFEINRKAILRSGLTLSSELLALGVLVEGEN